jgi:hypothetical protein
MLKKMSSRVIFGVVAVSTIVFSQWLNFDHVDTHMILFYAFGAIAGSVVTFMVVRK